MPDTRKAKLRSTPSPALIAAGMLILGGIQGLNRSDACTAYLLERGDERAVCRNYDFGVGEGLLLVNPRGLGKAGIPDRNPAQWSSTYGSVTLTQFGRELPLEGMNEAGLVAATLWLDETVQPADTTRPAIQSLQWVQLILDSAATVGEALALDSTVVISPGGGSTVHFFVADAAGNAAVVEYLDGRRVHHTGAGLVPPVITNDTYESSARFLAGLRPFGGSEEVPTDMTSLARFARAARYRQRFAREEGRGLVDYGFASLASVCSGMATQWSVVYLPGTRVIWLRSQRNQQIRSINLASLNFDPAQPARMLPIDVGTGELQSALVPYTTQANRDLIFRVFGQVDFLAGTPDEYKERLARFPERIRAIGGGGR